MSTEKVTLKDVEKGSKTIHVTSFGPLTVAESTFEKTVTTGTTSKVKMYHGWGWARQSTKDKTNPALGNNIALGRSRKALVLKLNKEPITSVFMG